MHNIKNCPIFCATEQSKSIINSSFTKDLYNVNKIELNVPISEIHKHQFYDWTDYIYYCEQLYDIWDYVKDKIKDYASKDYKVENISKNLEDEDYEQYCLENIRNLSQYIRREDIFDEDEEEIILDKIKPEWVFTLL